MPYVHVAASETVNYRGHMTEITSLAVGEEWDSQLREFCALMGIDTQDMHPAWWLVSYWG